MFNVNNGRVVVDTDFIRVFKYDLHTFIKDRGEEFDVDFIKILIEEVNVEFSLVVNTVYEVIVTKNDGEQLVSPKMGFGTDKGIFLLTDFIDGHVQGINHEFQLLSKLCDYENYRMGHLLGEEEVSSTLQ